MRADHIRVFRKAAAKFQCTIVVRDQNPLSAQYMGQSGFKPKPIWCHAKTAGNPNGPEPLQGLVVDPTTFPDAFKKRKLNSALDEWKSFVKNILNNRHGFKLNDTEGHPRFGCVLFHGDYLYSDYDLKSVTPSHGSHRKPIPDKDGKPVDMKHHKHRPFDYSTNIEKEIAKFFRERTGIALVQHGAAVNYPKDKGELEQCDVFLPVSPFHFTEYRSR